MRTFLAQTIAIVTVLLPIGPLHGEIGITTNLVKVVDGVVQPRRPLVDAISEAMNFLKKADDGYVPGNIKGRLAGYFTSALVNPDGSPSGRLLAYPARQHAYFIWTFLEYQKYSGEKEWLLRAQDLADWDLKHSTPPTDEYANLPYSTFRDGEPNGGADQDAIEPDKAAFLGSSYLRLFGTTKEARYLSAAKAIATTLTAHQNKDGSWPFRVVPGDGTVREEFGGAPVNFVEFFESLLRQSKNPEWKQAHDRALDLMLKRNVVSNRWGTYHEDVQPKNQTYLSAEPMSFTATYLFQHAREHPEYVEMGRDVIKHLEARLVHTDRHPAAPAPAVSEQAGFDHIMPGHTARYCMALAALFKARGDEMIKKRAISGVNALTYMQSEDGLFRTFFFTVHTNNPNRKKPDWYSQHLFTVCHLLEMLPLLPEAFPEAEQRKAKR